MSLSPRVEEPNSEVKKLINVRTWTTVSSPVNVLRISLYLNLYMYRWIEISFWLYDYGYCCEYTTHETKWHSRNLIKRINTWNVSLVRYSVPFLRWTREELKQIDQKTRKLMTMHKALDSRDDTDCMHQQTKKEENLKAFKIAWMH